MAAKDSSSTLRIPPMNLSKRSASEHAKSHARAIFPSIEFFASSISPTLGQERARTSPQSGGPAIHSTAVEDAAGDAASPLQAVALSTGSTPSAIESSGSLALQGFGAKAHNTLRLDAESRVRPGAGDPNVPERPDLTDPKVQRNLSEASSSPRRQTPRYRTFLSSPRVPFASRDRAAHIAELNDAHSVQHVVQDDPQWAVSLASTDSVLLEDACFAQADKSRRSVMHACSSLATDGHTLHVQAPSPRKILDIDEFRPSHSLSFDANPSPPLPRSGNALSAAAFGEMPEDSAIYEKKDRASLMEIASLAAKVRSKVDAFSNRPSPVVLQQEYEERKASPSAAVKEKQDELNAALADIAKATADSERIEKQETKAKHDEAMEARLREKRARAKDEENNSRERQMVMEAQVAESKHGDEMEVRLREDRVRAKDEEDRAHEEEAGEKRQGGQNEKVDAQQAIAHEQVVLGVNESANVEQRRNPGSSQASNSTRQKKMAFPPTVPAAFMNSRACSDASFAAESAGADDHKWHQVSIMMEHLRLQDQKLDGIKRQLDVLQKEVKLVRGHHQQTISCRCCVQ